MAIQDIYDRLAQATGFHPGQTEVFDDFLLDAGDVVQIFSEGEAFDLPIFKQHIDWVGSAMTTLTSTGNEQRSDLPPLQKKQKNRSYRTGRRLSDQEEQLVGYRADFIRTKKTVGMEAKAMGIQLDQDGNPVLDQDGEFVWDNTSAAEIFSRLILSPNRAELVSAINDGTGAQVSGAKVDLSAQGTVLIRAINNRPGQQSSVTIDADKINLNGVVTSTEMDTRLMNADALFSNTGYIGTIRASGITAGGNVVAEGAVYGSGIYLGTQAPYTSLGNAVYSFGTPTASGGQISIPWTKVDGTAGTPINFNIAATAYYQQHIGIQSVSAAGWTNDGEGGGYYNTVTATPKDGSASTEAVVLPTITVDTELGTNATTALQAYGPTVGSTKYPVSASTTVYLKADSDYCYITSNNNTPTVGTNVLARISNPGGGRGTVTAITATALGRHDTGVSTVGVSGTNLDAFAGDSTFSLVKSTYDTSSEATSSDHCVNLLHGSDIVGRINTESVYTDGITAGEAKFTLTTVTPQGASAGTIYKRKTSGSLRLVSQTITKGGTIHYYVRHTASETPTGAWYTRTTTKPSSGTTYNTECEYDGTATVYVSSSSGTYYYLGDGTDTTLYHEGTPDSTHYYTKTS